MREISTKVILEIIRFFMAVSSEMKLRLDKIDTLVEKGYLVKTKGIFLFPIVRSPQGAAVNPVFRGKYGDDALPGFSWVAFFFPFVFATKIRYWRFFWILGIFALFASIIESIFNMDISLAYDIGISMYYAFYYPFHRWLFVKSNREEFGTFESVLLGILLSLAAAIPSLIIYGIFSL